MALGPTNEVTKLFEMFEQHFGRWAKVTMLFLVYLAIGATAIVGVFLLKAYQYVAIPSWAIVHDIVKDQSANDAWRRLGQIGTFFFSAGLTAGATAQVAAFIWRRARREVASTSADILLTNWSMLIKMLVANGLDQGEAKNLTAFAVELEQQYATGAISGEEMSEKMMARIALVPTTMKEHPVAPV